LKQTQDFVAADAEEGGGLTGGHGKGLSVGHGVMTHEDREAILRENFR
jgi:hypothetical protein